MRKFQWIPIIAVCSLFTFLGASRSEAQIVDVGPWWYQPYPGVYAVDAVAEARRGWADIIRARGQAARDLAQARLNYELARSKYIENYQAWTDAYLERKRQLEADRREYHARRREARDRYLAMKRSQRPQQLSSDQFDPETGQIEWPAALLGDEFDPHREKLSEALVVRAHVGASDEVDDEILATTRDMQEVLKSRIRSMAPAEYLEARRFLDGLQNEIRYVTS